ncbi:hypothetical protein CIW52_06430 [Mycolicibacterium sp. P9-64]|uniref:hypothetical protein n=1 Tax=Mycolicibacterium sp. P9-64 TaxID=2024612 RepID=UPI0011F041EC|nr:hypothetical protein [Mycolicibacterium sp. P9-64]KAA0085532.1 hypothetical protein CIW52_06430 [Mycolicibacterium sp. P9-64]
MSKNDPEALAALSAEQRRELFAAAAGRCDTRLNRATAEQRDLTVREHQLTKADRDELEALQAAEQLVETRAAIETRGAELQAEIGRLADTRSAPFQPTLLVSAQHLEEHAVALRDGRPYGAVETRARVTAAGDLGSAGAWDPGQPNEPRHLIAFAGIPVSELTGRTAQVPVYTGPTGAAGLDENTDHTEYDAINPANLTGLRYGRWTNVSALANVVDDLRGINQMHAWAIARDLDLLAVTAVQTAASTPAVLDDLETQVRQAIWSVAAATYSDETALVIIGTPADLALLTGTTPANAGDLGSLPVRYNGAKLYPSLAATSEQVTVFAPGSFRVFQTKLQSASLIDPANGSNKFGSWIHSTGVAQQIVGSAAAVATAE